MTTLVKICGITTAETLKTACDAGADFIGFVFFPPSPRAITPAEAAPLIAAMPGHVKSVALFVNPTDAELTQVITDSPCDYVQLHGDESQNRVKAIHALTQKPIIKAFPVASRQDIEKAYAYENFIDIILFDHKPSTPNIHGGTGQTFDWSLLQNVHFKKPWMLSGGLNQNNVQEAITALNPDAIDVSSGVESSRGIKDNEKIINLIKEVKSNG